MMVLWVLYFVGLTTLVRGGKTCLRLSVPLISNTHNLARIQNLGKEQLSTADWAIKQEAASVMIRPDDSNLKCRIGVCKSGGKPPFLTCPLIRLLNSGEVICRVESLIAIVARGPGWGAP